MCWNKYGVKSPTEFKRWFAWYPVDIGTGNMVWFEWVERSKRFITYPSISSYYIYRNVEAV